MSMTTSEREEILQLYQGAKNKDTQIGILCELTLRPRCEILEALQAAGIEPPNRVRPGRKKGEKVKKWTEAEREQLAELCVQEMPIIRIAAILGRSTIAIASEKKRMGISQRQSSENAKKAMVKVDLQELQKMADAGLSQQAAAEALGTTVDKIERVAKRHGIKMEEGESA